MVHCAYHPSHEAVERCEICDQPLCGLCLWYGDDGRRLCEIHAKEVLAQGKLILPPDTYEEAVNNSLVRIPAHESASENSDPVRYKGNREDLNALLAFVIAITTLFSCVGGVYCLPLVAMVLGLVALSSSSKAIDPVRTRNLSGVALVIAGLMIACLLVYFIAIGGFVVIAFLANTSSP